MRLLRLELCAAGTLPVPAGRVDEPFRGPVGGGLTGGGDNWRMKLPVDLQETIPDSAALPDMVLRLPHNAIQEVRVRFHVITRRCLRVRVCFCL